MPIRKIFTTVFCLLAITTTGVAALEVPPLAGKRFHNNSTIVTFTGPETQALEDKLARFEKDFGGAQMAVLFIDRLDNEAIEDFSLKVAEAWKLGQKGTVGREGDNGLLLTVAIQEKKYRFEVGYGLEGKLPDSLVGTIGRDILAPSFHEGWYREGINAAIDAIGQALRGGPQPSLETKSDIPPDAFDAFLNKASERELGNSFLALCIMLVITVVLDCFHFLLGAAAGLITGGLFAWVFIGHEFGDLLLPAAIGFFVGMAGKYIAMFVIMLVLQGGSGDGGNGGFSGGGGGFGGGGASGGW